MKIVPDGQMTGTALRATSSQSGFAAGRSLQSYRHGTILYDERLPAAQFLLGRTRLHAHGFKDGIVANGQNDLGIAAVRMASRLMHMLALRPNIYHQH